uniref:peptidylprolyl isomerase n=1 Tax=Oryza barthii TaxID=65489 RepID=A0A0D3EQ89_9ORYZ
MVRAGTGATVGGQGQDWRRRGMALPNLPPPVVTCKSSGHGILDDKVNGGIHPHRCRSGPRPRFLASAAGLGVQARDTDSIPTAEPLYGLPALQPPAPSVEDEQGPFFHKHPKLKFMHKKKPCPRSSATATTCGCSANFKMGLFLIIEVMTTVNRSSQVIDGLDESVMTMEEGEVAEFTIPPQHAFDAVGSDQHQFPFVPRNATVVYKIELLSVVNEKHPLYIPSRSEIVEYASRKEKEGDIYFNLGKHLRAHRRYFKARQIIAYSRFGVRSGEFNLIKLLSIPTSEIDAQLEEMWISSTFKAAKCAIQLGCCKQASDYYGEDTVTSRF